MSDLGPLIESLEADVARLKVELARVKEREAGRVKEAFVEGYVLATPWDATHGDSEAREEAADVADRRLADGTL